MTPRGIPLRHKAIAVRRTPVRRSAFTHGPANDHAEEEVDDDGEVSHPSSVHRYVMSPPHFGSCGRRKVLRQQIRRHGRMLPQTSG
jgi:hypothetical protein